MKQIAFILSVICLLSCNDLERQKELEQRENILLEKEKAFAQKESEYQSLIKMRDSVFAKKDTVVYQSWPSNFLGTWNSKVVCIESNCSDYVIGDIRTDQWEFDSDSTQLVVKTINNKKLTRVYNASFENNVINMSFSSDSLAQKLVDMQVVLSDITDDKIKGTRVITIDNKCSAKFSVELVKNKKGLAQ